MKETCGKGRLKKTFDEMVKHDHQLLELMEEWQVIRTFGKVPCLRTSMNPSEIAVMTNIKCHINRAHTDGI